MFGVSSRSTLIPGTCGCPPGQPRPWAGVERVEATADLPPRRTLSLQPTSPRPCSLLRRRRVQDTRAPQNFYPIAALEREMKRRLGDQGLLYRALRAAV